MDLDGRTALVTGGAEGIGAGIAERLAAEGMHVVIADRDEEAGHATAARAGGSFVSADLATSVGVRAAIDAACRSAGPLGVLVNDAGGVQEPCFPAAEPAAWEGTLDLNLRAVMLATQLAPVLAPADIADAAMEFLGDDTLAGRIMVCRGGESRRLIPLIDWQTA
jgi:NAD(P)-dependent dehydrogenase (short-subunit alcohol dehydrogenase family)